MVRINYKIGFTLLELIVVMAIVALLIASLGGGYLSLQRSINLDNAIRSLKSEIEKTQNNARNSFLATSSTSVSIISLGWMVEFQKDNNDIKVVKRSIYFENTNNAFDLPNLRAYIINMYNSMNINGFSCSGSLPGTTSLFTGSNPAFLKPPAEYPIKCSDNKSGNTEFVEIKSGVNMDILLSSSFASTTQICPQKSFFFTSGYSEIATSKIGLTGTSCQIIIKSIDNSDTRAIKVDLRNGSVSVCGNYCE